MQVHGQLEADRGEGPGGVADAAGGGGNEQVAFHHVPRVQSHVAISDSDPRKSVCATSSVSHSLTGWPRVYDMPASDTESLYKLTFAYREVHGLSLLLDVYPPVVDVTTKNRKCPSVVYFHGGGLTVGNKQSWFPHWLHRAYIIFML